MNNRRLNVGYWLGDASLNSGGIGPYAWRTLRLLLSNPQEDIKLVVLCYAQVEARVRELIENLPASQSVEILVLPQLPARLRALLQPNLAPSIPDKSPNAQASTTPKTGLAVSKRVNALLLNSARTFRMNRWLARHNLDVLHFPTQLPVQFDLKLPYIVTMHDVQELHFPEYFTPEQRAFRAVNHGAAVDRARKVIVSFDHVKSDLMKYFHVPEEKIQVCSLSLDNLALPKPSVAAASVYDEKYSARKPYLLYPAQTWPHKNHLRLLDALAVARQRGLSHLGLICTGHKNEHQATIAAHAEELGLAGVVLFAGLVAEDELAWLYQQAALVVIPTEYEAGSYPLYEAMSVGAPVICSDVTSLPETIGDRRFLFSPYDVQAMADLIERMLTDGELRADNLQNSASQVLRLREYNPSGQFYKVYRQAVN